MWSYSSLSKGNSPRKKTHELFIPNFTVFYLFSKYPLRHVNNTFIKSRDYLNVSVLFVFHQSKNKCLVLLLHIMMIFNHMCSIYSFFTLMQTFRRKDRKKLNLFKKICDVDKSQQNFHDVLFILALTILLFRIFFYLL